MSHVRLVALVIIAGCGASEDFSIPEVIGPSIGTTHAVHVQAIRPMVAPDAGPAPMRSAPAEARRLLAATNELEVSRARPDRAHVVHALRALVDALETIAPDAGNAIDRAREAVDRLEHATATTPAARLLRTALDASGEALGDASPGPVDPQRYREALDGLRTATVKIDPGLPLLDEYTDVRAAFRAAVRVVFAATNSPEPGFENARNTARR